jgi:HK97 family phage portal protein
MGIRQRLARGFRAALTPSSSIINPTAWLVKLFGGAETAAGVQVDENSALGLSTVFACVKVIAEDIAKMPAVVKRELQPRGWEILPKHPVRFLLNRKNCFEMNAFEFRSTIIAHALLWGNGYAEIERKKNGDPLALWLQPPNRVGVHRDTVTRKIVYTFYGDFGAPAYLGTDDVFHLKGLGFDGLIGYSVVSKARESLGLALAAQRFGGALFANGAIPSGVLKTDKTLEDDAARRRLKASWNEKHQGPDKGRGVALLEGGMTYEAIGVSPEDGQFLETRQFQVPDVCRWFRVNPIMVGHADGAKAPQAIEQIMIAHVSDTLDPWLTRFEQETQSKLFTAGREDDLVLQHDRRVILRADVLTRARAHAIARQWGWESANDVREDEGENPIESGEGEGDAYLVPTNMTPADRLDDVIDSQTAGPAMQGGEDQGNGGESTKVDAGTSTKTIKPGKNSTRGHDPAMFVKLATSVLMSGARVAADKIGRAAKRDAAGFDGWLESFSREHQEHLATCLTPAVYGTIAGICARESMSDDQTSRALLKSGAIAADLAAAHVRHIRAALTPENTARAITISPATLTTDTGRGFAAILEATGATS